MSLMDPSLRFVSIRIGDTLHIFRNANRAEDGARRVEAQRLVSGYEATPERRHALEEFLRRGLDAIVVPSHAFPTLAGVLNEDHRNWTIAEETNEYRLILLEQPVVGVPGLVNTQR